MNNTISIIMPVYNCSEFLERSLNCFMNQTYKNIELVCIDDASTDNSLEILKSYQKIDNRIRIIESKENQGQGIGRNIAIKAATGDYIMFLDPDDTFELNACELAINQITKNNNDFVFFNFRVFYPDKRVLDGNILAPLLKEESNSHINPTLSRINMFHSLYVVVGIYKKSFILDNNIQFNSSRLCEDDIFYTKCWLYAKDVSIINKPLYNYYRRGNSSSYQAKDYKSILFAKRECYEACKNYYGNSHLLLNYVTYYIRSLLYYHKEYSQLDRRIEKSFFYEIKKVFKDLYDNEDVDLIKDDINYIIFNRIKNRSYFYYRFCLLFEKFFSIRRYKIAQRKNLIIKIFNKTFRIPLCDNRAIELLETNTCFVLNIHGLKYKIKQKSYKEIYKSLVKENNDLQEQIEYLKGLIPVNSLPTMKGPVRDAQLRVLDFTKRVCSEFEKQGIEYFLVAGSAIGAVRHAGFVPWDDDIDLGMMRKDYIACENYCKKHFIEVDISSIKINGNYIKSKYKVLQDAFKKYPNKIFFIKSYNTLQIFCGIDLNNFVSFDIFSYDFYRDGYTLQEHLKYLDSFILKVYASKNHGEAMKYINKELATNPNIVEKSNTIYYGIDSMTSFENTATYFYNADRILPLKKTRFEDTVLYVPNDLDYYIKNEIRDYQSWPAEIRMQQHLKKRSEISEKVCK